MKTRLRATEDKTQCKWLYMWQEFYITLLEDGIGLSPEVCDVI